MSYKFLKRNVKGFTLMELVITIALLTIAMGVTSDIILTLVRSYTKNQVSTEVEQSANFVFLKMEKELRNALSLTVNSGTLMTLINLNNQIIEYQVSGGVLQRRTGGSGSWYNLTTNSGLAQVTVGCTGGGSACFTLTNANPQTVRLTMSFSQPSIAGQSPITYNINNTVVVRGSY